MKLTKNFDSSEIICPSGCKDTAINMEVIEMAQKARDILNEPLNVPEGGGKRCKEYQRKEVGNYRSAHVTGDAIDLYRLPYGKTERMIELARVFQEVGFHRIGLYPSYGVRSVHGDIWMPELYWVRKSLEYIYFDSLDKAIAFVERS